MSSKKITRMSIGFSMIKVDVEPKDEIKFFEEERNNLIYWSLKVAERLNYVQKQLEKKQNENYK